eukprot:2395176-Pyramimonas_sp.AAC.1
MDNIGLTCRPTTRLALRQVSMEWPAQELVVSEEVEAMEYELMQVISKSSIVRTMVYTNPPPEDTHVPDPREGQAGCQAFPPTTRGSSLRPCSQAHTHQ